MNSRSYEELLHYETYLDRLRYLELNEEHSDVSRFNGLRHLNQSFYSSYEWRRVRSFIIARDWGFDLGVVGRNIFGKVIVHHINPITPDTLINHYNDVVNPSNLITVSNNTHLQIHHGIRVETTMTDRHRGDTKLW